MPKANHHPSAGIVRIRFKGFAQRASQAHGHPLVMRLLSNGRRALSMLWTPDPRAFANNADEFGTKETRGALLLQ